MIFGLGDLSLTHTNGLKKLWNQDDAKEELTKKSPF